MVEMIVTVCSGCEVGLRWEMYKEYECRNAQLTVVQGELAD